MIKIRIQKSESRIQNALQTNTETAGLVVVFILMLSSEFWILTPEFSPVPLTLGLGNGSTGATEGFRGADVGESPFPAL